MAYLYTPSDILAYNLLSKAVPLFRLEQPLLLRNHLADPAPRANTLDEDAELPLPPERRPARHAVLAQAQLVKQQHLGRVGCREPKHDVARDPQEGIRPAGKVPREKIPERTAGSHPPRGNAHGVQREGAAAAEPLDSGARPHVLGDSDGGAGGHCAGESLVICCVKICVSGCRRDAEAKRELSRGLWTVAVDRRWDEADVQTAIWLI